MPKQPLATRSEYKIQSCWRKETMQNFKVRLIELDTLSSTGRVVLIMLLNGASIPLKF